MNILMIGAGRMAESIISGLLKQNGELSITVANHSDDVKRIELANKFKIHETNNWSTAVEASEIIISAAPPSAHEQLFKELSPILNKQLVITVAAGIDTTFMQAHLPEGTPVCWIMPNTAAQLQASMSTFVCGHYVTSEHREVIEMILSAIGDYEELTEEQVHDLTAVTGSAPAFLYLFCEALEEAALIYGVSQEQARKLVTQMVAGSAQMLEAGFAPRDLRDQVTTPGGSTAAGISVLNDGNFTELIGEAIKATNEHARGRKN